jgi:hypothetical protein
LANPKALAAQVLVAQVLVAQVLMTKILAIAPFIAMQIMARSSLKWFNKVLLYRFKQP